MTANLSIIAASRGSSSQISMPGTLVAIGLNSPRISAGASGLRSNMSWCGGPPGRKTMMTALCELRIPACASAARSCGKRQPAQRQAADLQEVAPRDAVAEPPPRPACRVHIAIRLPEG